MPSSSLLFTGTFFANAQQIELYPFTASSSLCLILNPLRSIVLKGFFLPLLKQALPSLDEKFRAHAQLYLVAFRTFCEHFACWKGASAPINQRALVP